MSNLWILTEERPKNDVLQTIIGRFLNDRKVGFFANPLRIVPVLNNNQTFTFCYKVLGIDTPYIDNIYIKTVSGHSSFVDFLVYFQENEPKPNDIPIYAIEETKTDDSESRNTGVYQRCSKFVYIDYFYPNVKKKMCAVFVPDFLYSYIFFRTFVTKSVFVQSSQACSPTEVGKGLVSFKGV